MTLIAAYQEQGVPILVGDYLLTASGTRSGLTKKIYVISSNLAVGWTGDRVAAQVLLNDLFDEFNGCKVSKNQLEHFLANYPPENLGSYKMFLIGWVVDDGYHGFRWNSEWPVELFYDSRLFDGCGEVALKMLPVGVIMPSETSPQPNIDNAIKRALSTACRLTSDEILDGFNQRMGFGHGYEILYFNGEEFRYVDDVLYLAWDFLFDAKGKIVDNQLFTKFYKYRNFSNYSVIQIWNVVNRSLEIHFHIITPLCNKSPEVVERIKNEFVMRGGFPLESEYQCLYFTCISPENSVSVHTWVGKLGEPNSPFAIETQSKGMSITIQFEAIEWAYKVGNQQRNP